MNASAEYEKGRPKNFIPADKQSKIAELFHSWKEVEGKSKIIAKELAVKNDYNLSPTRYIQNGGSEELKSVNEIVAELESLESEAEKTDKELKKILGKIKL